MKKSQETTESRRARLEARRYHVDVLMESEVLDLHRRGELFFESLRAARDEVRKLYREWESWSWSTVTIKPSGWRDIWASSSFEVSFTEDGEPAYHFRAQIVDTKAPRREDDKPFRLEFDSPSDSAES